MQAEALAESFLDDIGSSKDELQPRGVYSELILLAGEMVEDMQNNLIKSRAISSGALAESIVADEPEKKGDELIINIMMNFYGKFVNAGVKGTRRGKSTAGYSFKNEVPSTKMVKAIADWIKRAQISVRTVKKYDGHGKHEVKQKSVAELDGAYAIARSIKQKGLKPRGFIDKAAATTTRKVRDRLGAALKVDIIDSITQK